MDRVQVAPDAAKAPEAMSSGATLAQIKPSSPTVPSRQSPTTPLVPLEFLQNQRRGSITDPSLHAAGPSAHPHATNSPTNSTKAPSSRNAEASAALGQQGSPPYRFGDATSAQPPESTSPNLRRLLRSPPADTSGRVPVDGGQESGASPTAREPNGLKNGDRMDVDPQSPQQTSDQGEYASRRPSLAGTKRKMSPERHAMPGLVNGELDPKLVGPGVPSMDSEGPAPKRRSSAFDTRLAQLQLNDPRSSFDARASSQAGATPVFAATPVSGGGYSASSSAFSGDSPHGRPPTGIATFAWPANPPPDQPQQSGPPPPPGNEAAMANNQGPYDPNLAMLPPVAFPPDRRMSAPALAPENMSVPPASGPARVLRSRSRPPSRVRGSNQGPPNNAEPSPGSSASASVQDDAHIAPPPPPQKEPGSTPYSRSPELRISHKLAERKRRKEMKDLFDELRDQLPADRGMKASKWEILSKAIDFIVNLKQGSEQMSAELNSLTQEVNMHRQAQGLPPYTPGAPPLSILYGHGPPVGAPPFPAPPPPGHPGPSGPGVPPPSHHPQAMPPQPPQQAPVSRPGSSQNMYPPGTGPVPPPPPPNGVVNAAPAQADAPS